MFYVCSLMLLIIVFYLAQLLENRLACCLFIFFKKKTGLPSGNRFLQTIMNIVSWLTIIMRVLRLKTVWNCFCIMLALDNFLLFAGTFQILHFAGHFGTLLTRPEILIFCNKLSELFFTKFWIMLLSFLVVKSVKNLVFYKFCFFQTYRWSILICNLALFQFFSFFCL